MEGFGKFIEAIAGRKKSKSKSSDPTSRMTGVDSARKQREGKPVVNKKPLSMKEQDKALGGEKKNKTLSKVGEGLKGFSRNNAANQQKARQISSRISSRRGRNLIDLR